MKYKHSLRFRITLSFFLFGTLLTVAIAYGVHLAIEDIEARLLEESLHMEFEEFARYHRDNPHNPVPRSTALITYLIDQGEEGRLPAFIRELADGPHELRAQDRVYQIFIGPVDGKRLILMRDATLFEEREDAIFSALLLAVLAASLLALWTGFALSRRVIAPVTNLARSVAGLTPAQPHQRLSQNYASDEVGELAHTFDRYLERMREFVAREQEFTANASHELRTPLTVIQGAVELLSAEPQLPMQQRRVLQRIERACHEMSQVVESLLLLAREDSIPHDARCRVSGVLQSLLDETRHLLAGKALTITTHIEHDLELPVPCIILTIAIGNLLRNAITYTSEGEIVVHVGHQVVHISDTGVGIRPEELPHLFERHFRGSDSGMGGSGLGLSIVKRICDRFGWRVEISALPERGTRVSLYFEHQDKTSLEDR